MDESRIRAWWSHRQGLDGSLQGKTAGEALERAGWARSVGGVAPYLTLFSRAGISREAADDAVRKLEIHELPSARGCTYVLPASDFALGLKVGEAFNGTEMKTAYKLGVTDKEVEKLCDAVLKALAKGPLAPDEIREATGNASRNMGEEGKKKGMITTLPLALGQLQVRGEIRRIPVNGRLDQQRYQYALWRPNPLTRFKLSTDERSECKPGRAQPSRDERSECKPGRAQPSRDESYLDLAKRYFRWIGPATLTEFQWFVGLGVKDTRAAVEPLKLVPVEEGSGRLMFADDREKFHSFKVPSKPQYSLVGGNDSLVLLRRDLKLLLDPKDITRPELKDPTPKAGSVLLDLPDHAILDRGRIIGLWEYDVDSQSIVWSTFGVKDKALNAVVEETQKYVRDQLGDARSFSLDSPKSRVPRIQILRKAAGK